MTLDRIYQAVHLLKPSVRRTEIIPYPGIKSDCDLYLKAENLQLTGSFKLRGAYFKISMLSDDEKQKGVIACSAGNHAQGVALAARDMGISATIFIPSVSPLSKIEATRRLGAEVRIIDGFYDDAHQAALKHQKESGGVFIHPFNDEDVIAGQGTIALEILECMPDVEAIVVPVGGGGLISGIAFAIKMLRPSCKVYGVQAAGAASMYSSLEKGELVRLPTVSTFADGIAVKAPGDLTFDMCCKYVDQVVTVTDDEIATAILTLMEQEKLVSEGAGAVSVAAILFHKLPLSGKKVCAIVSGGNVDVNILSRIISRGLRTTGRLSELTVEMIDKPGQLQEVSSVVAQLGANVIKVIHNPSGENTDINGCYLHLSLETKDKAHFQGIIETMQARGYNILP
ncbi:MAG: threonine ammonia-lyase [Oscillospiraceae bacterium]|nr:threonine ammonia-lyase [Oscillospiraceae bacterium]